MADLKTIIQITQDQLKKQVPTHEAVLAALDELRPRESEVIARRSGLRDGSVETLQEIGSGYGVSRERVRQIEKQGLTKFKDQLKKGPLTDILRLAMGLIREAGGVMGQTQLAQEFLPESQQTPASINSMKFLLEASGEVVLEAESKEVDASYGLSKAHLEAANAARPLLVSALKTAKKSLTPAELLDAVTKQDQLGDHAHLVTEPLVESVLQYSKGFVMADATHYGLATWSDINPKNIREKTLFVLKETQTPLHFKDITEKIREAKFDAKPVTTQAVHNELINGDEFVLIGRGIYALKDWGYLTGTVSDVIKQVLTTSGEPMERADVMEKVLKQRHVSENTILINLQDKSKFARVGKSQYVIAEGVKG
ncbi:hypothetical protein EXS54_01235 [Patescibacteria group bacterium]|nr:hypothetical protein [Patescibacteria group bacterium]